MTDQFAVVGFTTPSSGSLDITSPAITQTCKAAVVIYSAVTTDDSAQAHAVSGIGFVADDGNVDETTTAIAIRNTDALTTTQVCRTVKWLGSTGFTVIGAPRRSAAGTDTGIDIDLKYNSFISGGVRLDVTTGTDTTKGGALLFGGVARAYVGSFSASTSSAHENVGKTGTLFQPDLIILIGSDGAFAGGGNFNLIGTANLGFAIRTASGTTQLGALMGWNTGADPSDADGRLASAGIPSFDTSRNYQELTLTIDSTGFNHISTAGSPDFSYLAIQFSEAHRIAIQHLSAPAGTGNATFSPGFSPSVVMGFSTLLTTQDSTVDGATASVFGRFMFTPTQSRAVSCSATEGITVAVGTPSVTRTIQGDHAVQTLDHTGALAQVASYVGITDTGFTLNFTTATAGTLTALMIGPFVQNETVGISEGSVLVTSAFQFGETIGISEGVSYWVAAPFNETVAILDGYVLAATTLEHIQADRRGGTAEHGALEAGTLEGGAELGWTIG